MKTKTARKPHSGALIKSLLVIIPTSLLLFVSFLAFYSAKWYADTYGQLGFDSILYTLLSELNGVESDLVSDYISSALYPALYWSIPLCFVLFLVLPKRLVLEILPRFQMQLFPFRRMFSVAVSLVLSFCLIYCAAKDVQLLEYLKYISSESTIYQDHYQNPADAKITFPKEKRNLIYIFLESMETTYFSKEEGGILDYSIAPELYQMAQDNISFSHVDGFGGLYSPNGTTWTIAAMVAHSAAIPLKPPPGIGGNDYGSGDIFLPGAATLFDVLRDNGYNQALMVGSYANFGGRMAYYRSHGVNRIYDLYTAQQDGLVPGDYFVWWGIEDLHLFEYAKQKLSEMSAMDQPFAFSMLTVDTHFENGFICEKCSNEFAHQYENVISCSSKQVSEFIKWIQQQDFYENTTIVLVGDHLTMDYNYIQAVGAENFDRRVYNCIINSAVEASATKNRIAFTTDMFPTTLAAMGCTIEGNRLGLGTNLFSDTPTLAEELGLEALNDEMGANSSYYTSNFFFPDQ